MVWAWYGPGMGPPNGMKEGFLMKRTIAMILAVALMICMCVGNVAYAYGATFDGTDYPEEPYGGKTYPFYVSVNYDTTIYGLPIPSRFQLGMEIPYKAFNKPEYTAGSWKTVEFKKVTGALTGVTAYQAYMTHSSFSSMTLTIAAKAKAKTSGWSKATGYMGVGPHAIGCDRYFKMKKK